MSYDATETSAALGRPVEIYTWNRSTQVWRDTSADRDVVVESNTYTSRAMLRTGFEQGSELNRSGLKVTVARDHPVAALYRITPPSDVITLTLRQYHEGDGEVQIIWSGRILSVSHGPGTSEINLEPIATSVRRTGLRRMYQKGCPHVLYGPHCGVVAATYQEDFTVSAVSGLTITATGLDGHADGWWEGGFMRWEISAGIYEHRFIEGHTGNTITVDVQPLGLTPTTDISVFPGCDHTPDAGGCAKFSNILNYGGMPNIPTKNPYGSDPVF